MRLPLAFLDLSALPFGSLDAAFDYLHAMDPRLSLSWVGHSSLYVITVRPPLGLL